MGKPSINRRQFMTAAAAAGASLAMDWNQIAAYAARMGPPQDYPVVVIGAGLGGLTCAACLARAHIPVTVVEQHRIPGGYATAFERERGRFRFEVSLHGTALGDNTPGRLLKELGVWDKLALVRLPELFRIRRGPDEIVVPQSNPAAFVRTLSRRYPEEAAGIEAFIAQLMAIYAETEQWGRKSALTRTLSMALFPVLYPNMWKVRNQTLADLLSASVQSTEVKEVLAFLWGYYGLPPSKLSAFYYAVATAGYLKHGSWSIQERSQNLSDALVEVIEEAGGTVVYNRKVETVQLADGAVTGVTTADGAQLPARAVVSNASAPALFDRMLPPEALPADYRRQLQSYRPSISSFIVWLGLDHPLRGRIPGFTTHVSAEGSSEQAYARCLQGDIARMSYSVSVYDNLYDGYSSPGTSSLMLLALCGYAPWRPFERDYRKGRKAAYAEQKSNWARTLVRRAEKDLIPGLSSMIAVSEAATPLTNWRYTGNPEGAIYGYEQSLENAFMNRIANKTPVKGLYLAGAWGNPGGGYTGVLRSGQQTFRQMMKDWGA
jgi:phytoene dehydrogenase-like protein